MNVTALRAYLHTPDAHRTSYNKHGASYGRTNKQLVDGFLQHLTLPHPDAGVGYIDIRYWYGKLGTSMVDAGIVGTSREYPVPPDWAKDPFNLPKAIRGLALGQHIDFDDAAAHPRARWAARR